MKSVTVNGGFASADFGQVWIANQAGYFRKQGLTVNMINTSLGGANSTAVLLSGATQFVVVGGASLVAADQTGGSVVQAIAALDYGSTEQLVITPALAARQHIATVARTAAQAKAQLLALKGSHATIAESTTSSDAHTWLVALLKINGLTVGVGSPGNTNFDVNMNPLGTPPLGIAGYNAGKVDGFVNTPPNTTAPNIIAPSVTIPIHLIAPASTAMWGVVASATSFIKAHPDTVQAFMNALVLANHLQKTHPAQAFRLVQNMFVQGQITSPEIMQFVFAGNTAEWLDLVPTRTGYAHLVQLINEAGVINVNVPYETFNAPKFAVQAYKNAGLKVPVLK
jgi:ABC-type nitrate/sulfonate/bicarbonate transport system substrate-binding protein